MMLRRWVMLRVMLRVMFDVRVMLGVMLRVMVHWCEGAVVRVDGACE